MAIVCATCFGTGTALGAVVIVKTIVAVPTGNFVSVPIPITSNGLTSHVQLPEMTTALVDGVAAGPTCLLCNGSGILLG